MELTDFFSVPQSAPTLDQVTRVLVYPNITWQEDLTKDSYIQVISKMIAHLNQKRSDLWFYLIQPQALAMTQFPNVTHLLYPMPTYPNQMRAHFDSQALLKLLSKKYEFDVVFSHLPEHALALNNLLYNKTHFRPSMFGYCHWFELKNVTKYPKNMLPVNLSGLLEMQVCFLNTLAQKQLVLDEAAKWFNSWTVKKLDDILQPFYLGVDKSDVVDAPKVPEKIIVFNHRPQVYKNFDGFLAITDKLYKQRQDFRVWVPLLEQSVRPYIVTDKHPKAEYYQKLQTCAVGFSPRQEYAGWSVATTDGLMNGCPFIMFDAPYYRELWPNADFFTSDEDAIGLLNRYLNDSHYRKLQSKEAIAYCKNSLLYDNSIDKISDALNATRDSVRCVGEKSAAYKSVLKMIKAAGSMTKEAIAKQLKWGSSFEWTPYRRRLMLEPHIQEELSAIPTYHYVKGK